MASADFKTRCAAQSPSPRIRFQFDGTPYNDDLIRVAQIRRDDRCTSGTCNIVLQNIDQTWNIFRTSPTNLGLGKYVELELYFSDLAEYEPLFKGNVIKVKYNADATVTLHCRDRMYTMLEKRIGSGHSAADFTASAYNPADLVWHPTNPSVLTTYGELDTTNNNGNTDIDWDAHQAWKSSLSTDQYSIKAYFTGRTIRNALAEIADITNSSIWVNGHGKIDFAPPFNAHTGDRVFTRSNSIIECEVETEEIMNKFTCGYDLDIDDYDFSSWANTQDNTSISTYGEVVLDQEGKNVWHADATSAGKFITDRKATYKDPIVRPIIESCLYGYLGYIGDSATVTEALIGFSSTTVRIEELDMDILNGTVKLKAIIT